MTVLRSASPNDVWKIRSLHIAAIEAHGPRAYDDEQVAAWAEKETDPDPGSVEDTDQHVIVAEVDDSVVGFGKLVPDHREVQAVYVHPDFTRQGIGYAILEKLENLAVGLGIDTLELQSSLNAVKFYEVHGFSQVREDTVEKQYDGALVTIPVVTMEKSLNRE